MLVFFFPPYPFEIIQACRVTKEPRLSLVIQGLRTVRESPVALSASEQERLLRKGHRWHIELSLECDDARVTAEVAQAAVAHRQVVQGALQLLAMVTRERPLVLSRASSVGGSLDYSRLHQRLGRGLNLSGHPGALRWDNVGGLRGTGTGRHCSRCRVTGGRGQNFLHAFLRTELVDFATTGFAFH